MKTLRNLIEKHSKFSISGKNINDLFEIEIKNYELFSESELKSYFSSEKFLKDLYGCLPDFYASQDKGLLHFFVLKKSADGITINLSALSIHN